MGHELYRMIRDGAPASWTGPMVHVAQAVADDARDPDGTQDELPWSALSIQGRRDTRGRWRDGLTERTGMSTRAIRRALEDLADAGYEMRQAIGADKRGRLVYAAKGHAVRFQVPPLMPRPQPQSSPDSATITAPGPVDNPSRDMSPDAPKVAKDGQLYPPKVAKDGQLYPPKVAKDGQLYPPKVAKDAAKVAKDGHPISSESPQGLSPQEDLSPQHMDLAVRPEVEGARARPSQDRFISDEEWERRERVAARTLGPLPLAAS
jgi:hypothetical protein